MVLFLIFGKMNTACLVAFVYSNHCIFIMVAGAYFHSCQTSMNVHVHGEKSHVSMCNGLFVSDIY